MVIGARPRNKISRREALRLSSAAAVVAAAKTAFPSGAFAQGAGPETTAAALGFTPFTDAAPLIIAKEKGFFAKFGMADVQVIKQASFGAMRDNLMAGSAAGGLDGAQMLTPMPYLIATGAATEDNKPLPMHILARLNLDGQGISVSGEYRDLAVETDASPLKLDFELQKATVKWVRAGQTFPGGTHDLFLRYWLAAGGIDPDKDVETITVPPAWMPGYMRFGTLDLCCTGEPWNSQIVSRKVGYLAVTTGEIWAKHPEKSLGLRADWVDRNPRAAKALTMGVQSAQMWCDDPANTNELCEILAPRLSVPVSDILTRIKGEFNYGTGKVVKNSPHAMKFWRDNASYPFRSHDAWFLTENIRWGRLAPQTDVKGLIDKVNREDIWRDAAKDLGVKEVPASQSRGKETFFDGKTFDPDDPSAYLASLAIKRTG